MASTSASDGNKTRAAGARGIADDSLEGIHVGRVLRPHGLRGELKVEVWSDVEERFDVGKSLRVEHGGRWRRLEIVGSRRDRGSVLLKLATIEDRDASEALRGAILSVDAAEVPEPPEGFYYHYQLVGCRCVDIADGGSVSEGGRELGVVREVIEDGGGHLLKVESAERAAVLVPFVDVFLRLVDIDRHLIVVELPEGLIETCTSAS